MSMRDLARRRAILALGGFYGDNLLESSAFNNYESPKLIGFTQVKGRRRLSKKQRKQQLKNRKK